MSAPGVSRVCMFVYNTLEHDARVRKEARTLTEAGYQVTVVCVLDPGRTPRQETIHGFQVIRQSRSVLGLSRREIMELLRGKRREPTPRPAVSSAGVTRRASRSAGPLELLAKPLFYAPKRAMVFLRFVRAGLRTGADVYHAHDLNTLLMARTASWLRRKPLIYDSHEVETSRANQKFRWWAAFLERRLIHRADRVICTNQTRADYTQERYGIPPPTIVRNLPDYHETPPSHLLHERMGLPAETKVVLYQGGIQPERGLEQIVSAAPQIRGGIVVMLGSGRLKSALVARVRTEGLQDRVLFHDAVPVDELPGWTASAYVGLQVLQNTCYNHYSSLSNKLLEYLMAGVPVVASDLPEMRRVVEHTTAGLVVDTSDPGQIAAAVNELLGDPARREEMAERARETRREYCWERERQVLVDLYRELLSARG